MTPTPHPAIAARRARVRRIRARVTAGAIALFIAAFSGLYVQMTSGNDPVLGAESAQVATAGASASSTTSTSSTTPDAAPMTTSAS
jgi:hypothetical protein